MANMYWIGGTTAVQQENRFTPGGTIEVGDKFIVTLTAEDGSTTGVITAVATDTTVTQVCADLLTAWNASTSALKNGITASNQTTYFKLLGTAGVPFYAAATTTESDDSAADAQTFTKTATTPCVGPSDWNTAANWSGGAVPASSDNVTLDGRATADIVYGLVQTGVTLTSLTADLSFAGKSVGTTGLALKIGATTAYVGIGTGSGWALLNLNFGTVQTTVNMTGGRTTYTSGLPTTLIAGTHASNAVNLSSGLLGVGMLTPGQSSTIATANVAGGILLYGSGVTWTTINNNGGTVKTNSGGTTFNQTKGNSTVDGTALITTMTASAGTVTMLIRPAAGAAITTLNLRGATIDATAKSAAFTITALNFRQGRLRAFSPSQITITTLAFDWDVNTDLTLQAA